ncbi:toxin-antitoxin system HicB family antitoxin [Dermatobacter hominis]|uniref:toxin-antitoxin system HicB family antitoxin n=1 Tax=Dermatobacter hominis TaxID=2884263 RepID=UPI001D12271A|nr:toxin-antitoxin system HicB family antitoxin [Dermatobacter hominis]UDY35875.1 toxin-antitoxin system HicB family antitoxin [Dermatobacter hominis]
MDLSRHVDMLQHQLLAVADPAGDQARDLAALLVGSLDPSARLMLLDALADACDEITRELAPGSVEVRLRGRDPEFVVTAPPTDLAAGGVDDVTVTSPPVAAPPEPAAEDDGGTARVTLRLPEQLKQRIEQAAGAEGVSVNSWLVRTVTTALDGSGRPPSTSRRGYGQRVTGWAR